MADSSLARIMSVLKNPFFWIPCILFWANQYLEKIKGLFLPFLHSYLDDLLAIPVVLGITLQAFRWMHQDHQQMIFTKKQIIIGLIYFGLLFEGLLPAWSLVYVRDPMDLVCYSIGAIYFWFFINKKGVDNRIIK
ncbi:hypothetical protein Cycma_1681 [Cyclobacterium marinum DSM 745]|uniref:Magnesium citrate secondary transporter n=1 Tax=Cyclobacterium marinum (strain ATCC 25205 / DSM 745 / LMG 13164 / NCIMB 1802) TaxID=880070 RepID=G0IUP3_CYCMS|nr:hypothetical protein Cycma_1681 [Cyclobacterium marinum DSM 745]